MTRYIVMNERAEASGETIRFVRDGFHAFAFVLPVVWLLWNRLWLEAALAFAAMGICAAATNAFIPDALPAMSAMFKLAIGLLVALEGPAWLVADLERQGLVARDVVIGRSLHEAEEIVASKMNAVAKPAPAASGSFRPVSQTSLIPLAGV
ncbi:MAG: DUF2628 domain-containing protein [Rhizobiaceae bacterium]